MSLSAYRRTIVETESPRDIERRILTRITAELATHQEHYDGAVSAAEKLAILSGSLRPALARNARFWSAMRVDLTSPGNDLPPDARAGLISISLFVDRQIAAVLAGTGTVKGLVEVNNAIISGLSGSAPESAEPA